MIELAVVRDLEGDILHGLFPAHHSRGCHDGVDELLVAGAAAQVVVLGKPVTDVLSGRIRVHVQKGLGGNDEAGRAEAALNAAVGDPCLLKGMQVVRGAEALEGLDHGVLRDLSVFLDTCAAGLAVQDDGADAALTGAAAEFHRSKAGSAQNVSQGILLRIAEQDALYSVDDEYAFSDCHKYSPLSLRFLVICIGRAGCSIRPVVF